MWGWIMMGAVVAVITFLHGCDLGFGETHFAAEREPTIAIDAEAMPLRFELTVPIPVWSQAYNEVRGCGCRAPVYSLEQAKWPDMVKVVLIGQAGQISCALGKIDGHR